MKLLLVGDPHVKKTNIEESERLMNWVMQQGKENKVQSILLLGDQFDSHGIVHLEVLSFWRRFFETALINDLHVTAMTGNHDQDATGQMSAMSAFVGGRHSIITEPQQSLRSSVGYIPYIRKNESALAAMTDQIKNGAKVIFCHADINGAQYENGMYAPHGLDIESIPADVLIVSGHIHKRQEFRNVWYPGTARMLSRSDIGEQKGIWVFDTDTRERQFIPTPSTVCEPFVEIKIQEGVNENIDLTKASGSRVYIDVHGSEDFIKKTLKKLPDEAKVRVFKPNDVTSFKVKESDGLPKAFLNYAIDYATEKELTNDDTKLILSTVFSVCPSLKG